MKPQISALVLSVFFLAAVTHEADAALDRHGSDFGKIDEAISDFRAKGSLLLAKEHNCSAYGKANNCKAKWFKSTKECKCMG